MFLIQLRFLYILQHSIGQDSEIIKGMKVHVLYDIEVQIPPSITTTKTSK